VMPATEVTPEVSGHAADGDAAAECPVSSSLHVPRPDRSPLLRRDHRRDCRPGLSLYPYPDNAGHSEPGKETT
jgi:hypothetical protein